MSACTVLVVDDEAQVRDVVTHALTRGGYSVATASTFQDAERISQSGSFDAVVLDLMLPGGHGLDFLKRLRSKSNVPVIILSSLDEESDIVAGLELGADDYLKKPFSPRELTARIRAVLRRREEPLKRETIQHGNLQVDPERHQAWWKEIEIRLTPSELTVLVQLVSEPTRVHTRESLLRAIHGFDPATSERVIDTHVKELRRKLRRVDKNAATIETVPGIGYRIQ